MPLASRPPAPRRRLARALALPLALAAVLAAGCASGTPVGADDPTVRPDTAGGGRPPALLEALPRPLTAVERQAVTVGNGFSLGLFREAARRKAGENVVLSPLSAAVALAMTAQGAGGATDRAMRTTLGFGAQTATEMGEGYRGLVDLLVKLDPSVTLTSANAIWHRTTLPVLPTFASDARRLFAADVRGANFEDPATLAAINAWAREKTAGKIPQVLDRIERDHLMFLLNALYFKGAWRARFDSAATRPAAFTNADGRVVQVPTMRRDGRMRAAAGDGWQAVDLPYGNGAFSMTVVLPARGRSADALAAALDTTRWREITTRTFDAEVDLSLPRFTARYSDEWNDVLTTLGMGVAFSDAADFSRMVQNGGVKIGFVKQDAVIEVNEQGTEAAAVTTIGIVPVSAPVRQEIRVDRPFVFAIRERLTGAILFMGVVNRLPGS